MKKNVAILITISLIGLSQVDLQAMEKQGSTIRVFSRDFLPIEGELIAVKKNALLILDSTSTRDISVEFHKITTITIEKNNRTALYTIAGGAVGLTLGAVVGFSSGDDPPGFFSMRAEEKALVAGVVFGLTGGALGLITGVLDSRDEKIYIEGISEIEMRNILKYLRSKARVPDYK